jgi:carbon starvation protein
MLALIALGVMALLCIGYFAYGSLIAKQYNLDDARVTPAVQKADGVDFVPSKPFYLLGQHFSAIAAAGPIVGPIAAEASLAGDPASFGSCWA